MKILIHDFGGYSFPIELSREFAERGHEAIHAYCGSIETTPTGELDYRDDDPNTLKIECLELPEPLTKYSYVKRFKQENHFGRILARTIVKHRPDIVLSANAPLDTQRNLMRACRKNKIPFVFWLQDIIGIATEKVLSGKIPVLGKWIGRHYLGMEKRMLRSSDLVLVITEDFKPVMLDWGIDQAKIMVLENWAPLSSLKIQPKENSWSSSQGLSEKFCFVYTGTMGMKHNPEVVLELAKRFRDQEDVVVLVVSCGLGADYLREQASLLGLTNLRVIGFQPFDDVPNVMGTADVLIAVLEPDAGQFSVPSKVLAYLCAGRPLLLSIPPENLAARIVLKSQAGLVQDPSDTDSFVESAVSLYEDAVVRGQMGAAARAYAEATFDVGVIADRLLPELRKVVGSA